MLISSLKLPCVQLYLQPRAVCRGTLHIIRNQFARAALVVALMVPAVAHADVAVPGEDASGYQTAVQLWLEGSNDLEALRQLSGLANEGNTAAQMLLSSIARAEHTHIAVTQSLQRRERIALLREDVGLSGRDWLQRASEHRSLLRRIGATYPQPLGGDMTLMQWTSYSLTGKFGTVFGL